MLLRTLFVLALLAALAETFVAGAHALAQATLRRAASLAVREALDSGTTSAQQAIARAIERGADPQSPAPAVPADSPRCALANANGCELSAQDEIFFGGVPAARATPCPNGACTVYTQANDAVDEGRIDASIAARAVTASGAVLASRTVVVTFRTMRSPPYATQAGALDASLAAPAKWGPGDDGGAAPSGAAPGSLIDVIYENATNGRTLSANAWHPAVQHPGPAPQAWSP